MNKTRGNYPQIKFLLDSEIWDKHYLKIFGRSSDYLRPEIRFIYRLPAKDRQKVLNAYVDNFYELNKKNLEKDIVAAEKDWKKVEKYFFIQADKIFDYFPWPKGNYRGVLTIWKIFPRNIYSTLFAFAANSVCTRERACSNNAIIAHEMLHFIMYDYLIKKYKLKPSEHRDKDNKFWQFTENFNTLIEHEKIWHRFTNGISHPPYNDCKKLYVKMKKIWLKDKNLDNLIIKTFDIKNG